METALQQPGTQQKESIFEVYKRVNELYLSSGALQISGRDVYPSTGMDERRAELFKEFLDCIRSGGLERIALLIDDEHNGLRISVQNRAPAQRSVCLNATITKHNQQLMGYAARLDYHGGKTITRADTEKKLPLNESKKALNARGRKLIEESLAYLSL